MSQKGTQQRDPATIRAELEALRARPWPQDLQLGETRRDTEHALECELADAEGRPRPQRTHNGVM